MTLTPDAGGMSFALTDDQRLILQHVRDYCRAEIAPRAAEFDRSGQYPREQLRGLADLGLLGATVPEQWGGAGLDSVTYALCLEEIAAADASVAVIVSVQNGLPEQMILRYGNDAQRFQALYRGEGCLTYTAGNVFGGGGSELIRITAAPAGNCTD